jgi:hypothetical protein
MTKPNDKPIELLGVTNKDAVLDVSARVPNELEF